MFDRQRSGERVYDLDADGVAHYGLYADLLADMQEQTGRRCSARPSGQLRDTCGLGSGPSSTAERDAGTAAVLPPPSMTAVSPVTALAVRRNRTTSAISGAQRVHSSGVAPLAVWKT